MKNARARNGRCRRWRTTRRNTEKANGKYGSERGVKDKCGR
jgi:hypothetical protein